MKNRSFIAVVAVACASLFAGCGSSILEAPPPPATHDDRRTEPGTAKGPATGDTYVALVDASYSTTRSRPAYREDLEAVALRAAGARGRLYADAFDGDPSARIRWAVQGDFTHVPDVYDGNEKLGAAHAHHEAVKLMPRLDGLLQVQPSRAGTPLGPVLAMIAGVCGQQHDRHCRAYVFTDGLFIGEEFDARRPPSAHARARLAARWADRLAGLNGAEVRFVGVGYGSHAGQRTLENSHKTAQAMVTAAGGRVADWNVRLAPDA